MKLSQATHYQMLKFMKKERDPLEVFCCTVMSTLLYLYVYYILESRMRHDSPALAYILGPGVVLIICLAFTAFAVIKKMQKERQLLHGGESQPIYSVRANRNRNLSINLAVVSWGALIAGWFLGDRNYWMYKTNVYSYDNLVSYTAVDPARDVGQSYMDAGLVYFKEHSYVLKTNFAKFRNGDIYCVAPIVRGPFKPTAGSTPHGKVVNGYVVPEGGAYDFWAVGTDCCGGKGSTVAATNFTCGQVGNPLARAGMRLLSDNQRPFYLLAVQEWSATYGLPVKHPLFFTWVKDPLEREARYAQDSEDDLWETVGLFFLAAFIVSFLIHLALHKSGIY